MDFAVEARPLACALLLAALAAGGCNEPRQAAAPTPAAPPPAPEPPAVRPPAVAGAFYPGAGSALAALVDGYLAAAPAVAVTGAVGALVAPHAGYVYSGPTAGRAYKAVQGRSFDAVVVVAPSHHVAFHGFSVWWKGALRTPLGDVPVDEDLARALLAGSRLGTFRPDAEVREHAMEVHLPFLQRALTGPFKVVPVVMADQDEAVVRELAQALAQACAGRRVLLVASTDLSHYHDLDAARRLDGPVAAALAAADPDALARCLAAGSEACGGGPVQAVMRAARALGFDRGLVTGYDTSATASGDAQRVVGYVSAVFSGEGKAAVAKKGEGSGAAHQASTEIFSLSEDEKRTLLKLARDTVVAGAAGQEPPAATATTEKLSRRSGAFVTLKKKGELRGCIGFIVAQKPLVETIREMALSAAFSDPRFPAVTAGEVPALDFEISVLSPFRKIKDPSEIVVGRDGIQLSRGWNRGLLLPQVATEYGWDRDTFLEHTCYKAGLPPAAWKDPGTEIQIFSAEIFNEAELGLGPHAK